jgi:spermidine synthase
MRRFDALIFLTGAATLALEVLASRILTPYFGVSLYIWSGILAVTLAFLAMGYAYGGKLSRRLSGSELETRYLGAPVLAAFAVFAAALVYPVVMPMLARLDLIGGSFIGAALLLGFPLVVLSAMNPLLVGLARKAKGEAGDVGAGRVFFVSTVGSVVGVLFTAFVFIPHLSNYRAVLLVGLVLALAAGIVALQASAEIKARWLRWGGAACVALVALLGLKDSYLAWATPNPAGDVIFEIDQEYTSMFGNIKAVSVRRANSTEDQQKMFVQDGLLQNRTTDDDFSLSSYTYVLEALAHAYQPDMKDVLVLGLGAGIVPREFKRDGLAVAVVEINADSLTAARRHFGFDPAGIDIHLEDARTFIRGCRGGFDTVVMDLFLGDNTPDYLLTREFFADVKRCLRPQGVVVMNAFLDEDDDTPNQRLLATIMTAFPRVFRYGFPQGNSFIVGTAGQAALASPVGRRVAIQLAPIVGPLLSSGREIRPEYYVGFEPVSDDHNIFGVLFANAQMKLRRALAGQLPPRLLVN